MSTNVDPRNVTVGEASAPAEPRTEAQIQADLERQRAELAATIDQLYARVQPAALAQEAKEEASARFASFKQSASLTLQDAAGGNAEAIKKVGIEARRDLEQMLGCKVFLDMQVKVKKNWRRDLNQIRRFGYGEGM